MELAGLAKIDPASAVPRYVQAKAILAEAIHRGVFPPGTKLPSARDLGRRVNVSLVTAHKAIQCLVAEGRVRCERGRGTFVCDQRDARAAARPRCRIALVLRPINTLGDFYHGALFQGIRRAAMESPLRSEIIIHPLDDLRELRHSASRRLRRAVQG